jgi:hypothetical protein
MRLHLALFPAGGPFLSSLYVNLYQTLADQAVQAGGAGLSWAAFILGAIWGLSVALCWGNASLCWSGACVATRASGRTSMRDLARPSAEVVEACLTPHVYNLRFWFGFALRCVALLCAVCVGLHLVLFRLAGLFFCLSL